MKVCEDEDKNNIMASHVVGHQHQRPLSTTLNWNSIHNNQPSPLALLRHS